MNFGILVKRKTFLKGLLFVLACILALFIYDTRVFQSTVDDTQSPNEDLTWQRFINECAGGANNARAQYNFEHIYQN